VQTNREVIMTSKPTHKKLEKRVEELEQEIFSLKRIKKRIEHLKVRAMRSVAKLIAREGNRELSRIGRFIKPREEVVGTFGARGGQHGIRAGGRTGGSG